MANISGWLTLAELSLLVWVSVLLVFFMSVHLYLIQPHCHKVRASLGAFLRFVHALRSTFGEAWTNNVFNTTLVKQVRVCPSLHKIIAKLDQVLNTFKPLDIAATNCTRQAIQKPLNLRLVICKCELQHHKGKRKMSKKSLCKLRMFTVFDVPLRKYFWTVPP